MDVLMLKSAEQFISIGPGGFTVAGLGMSLIQSSSFHFTKLQIPSAAYKTQPVIMNILTRLFTVLLGQKSQDIIPAGFQGEEYDVFVMQLISVLVGLWLWGLSFWFFLVSVGSLWKYLIPGHRMPFQMTWWSFVFPNTALVTATMALASALDSSGLRILGCTMAVCLIIVWVLVFATMIKCLVKRQLLWPDCPDEK